jgi:hypothetical protein
MIGGITYKINVHIPDAANFFSSLKCHGYPFARLILIAVQYCLETGKASGACSYYTYRLLLDVGGEARTA